MPCTLYYFYDPMCSWCWAFRPFWDEIVSGLPDGIVTQRVLGGLAADTAQIMPIAMQLKLQGVWRDIRQTVPDTRFNFEFWEKCTPRRSTYAACRAVIAARQQAPCLEEAMILAIQKAYYTEARNPADQSTLIALATEIGLDKMAFAAAINSPSVHEAHVKEIELKQRLGVKGFPTLLLEKEGGFHAIELAPFDAKAILEQINEQIKKA